MLKNFGPSISTTDESLDTDFKGEMQWNLILLLLTAVKVKISFVFVVDNNNKGFLVAVY